MSGSAQALRFVAFGDSVTVGAKATLNHRRWVSVFCNQWEEITGRMIQAWNAGVGDNTISPRTTNYVEASKPSALERLSQDVVERNPHLVTVAFGLNDLRFGTPVQVFEEDLNEVVSRIRRGVSRARVVLLTPSHMSNFATFPPRDRGSLEAGWAYRNAIARVAELHSVPLADVWSAMAGQDLLIDPDGVHPNDRGQRVIALQVLQTVLSRLPQLPNDL